MVIEVKNLNFSFGYGALVQPVLKGINIAIQKGEIVLMTAAPPVLEKQPCLRLLVACVRLRAGVY